ncbi:hypothetical protein Cgig2_011122 [Carnegiea gigantea]|uniref:F-box protein n=1 Tax=Carnegiea gigantea TaxID=171969 RepID=A0A9Q1JUG5_9CARY|nr:hypothetical protein Cgig2_011122 [Carnegiea gigantea]
MEAPDASKTAGLGLNCSCWRPVMSWSRFGAGGELSPQSTGPADGGARGKGVGKVGGGRFSPASSGRGELTEDGIGGSGGAVWVQPGLSATGRERGWSRGCGFGVLGRTGSSEERGSSRQKHTGEGMEGGCDMISGDWQQVSESSKRYYLTLYSDVLAPFGGLYPPFPRIHTDPDHLHCLLNGVFHWIAWEGIVAFDMVNESFQLIEEPTPPDKYYNCSSAWVLKQTLALFLCSISIDNNPSNTVELWMMMKYGIADTRTMLHSFDGLYRLGIPNDHHVFLCNDKDQLISFRLDDHQIKEYGIYGAPALYENLPSIHKNLGVAKYAENIESLKRIHQ